MSATHHLAPQVAALEDRVARLVAERDEARTLIVEWAEAENFNAPRADMNIPAEAAHWHAVMGPVFQRRKATVAALFAYAKKEGARG